MSRGFVKEGDREEVPLVPPRAYLPDGVSNYVTPCGFNALKKEQDSLTLQRRLLREENADKNRVQINFITSKLDLLAARINSAHVVNVANQPKDRVLFGATVTLCEERQDANTTYQIVGVDEADVSLNKISFISPFAKALQGKMVGEQVVLKTPKGERKMKVKSIEYKV